MKKLLRKLTHRRFKSAEDLFSKRTLFGEINEFLRWHAISSDTQEYTLPFLSNPFRAKQEKESWSYRGALEYEYTEDHMDWDQAHDRFNLAYELLKDRISPDCKIFDVGCATGWFLERWREKGFHNLHGLDANAGTVEWANKNRPHLKIKYGFFGPPENDVECDLLIFFKTITRVAYSDGLFDAIARCANHYVYLGWMDNYKTLFLRDYHVGLAKKGFLCIEKRVVNERTDIPIGLPGADGPLFEKVGTAKNQTTFTCNYLFKRVEPR